VGILVPPEKTLTWYEIAVTGFPLDLLVYFIDTRVQNFDRDVYWWEEVFDPSTKSGCFGVGWIDKDLTSWCQLDFAV
jgi:hypothetical protein